MKIKQIQAIAVALSCVGMMVAPVAAAPVVSKQVVQSPRDVALHQGGILVGQMLDAQGTAIAGAAVSVQASGKEVARVLTDQTGKFKVTGLNGGVHLVATNGQQEVCRLWAPRTAPPAAQQGLMLVSGKDIVRGQCGCGAPVCGSACGGGGAGGIAGWVANHPIITAGAIGAAIAIPLAVDDDSPATP